MFGDGSCNQGQLFEAVNMAGLWKLPVVYTIENNHYGMGTSVERASAQTDLMAKFRGTPGINVDGQDTFLMRETTKWCKNFAIEHGPLFLEIDTYRYQGHSMSDPGITYRKKEEIEEFKHERDCIDKIKKIILEHSFATEKELKAIERNIRANIEADIEKIKKDPMPAMNEQFTNIYVNNEPHFIRGSEIENSITEPKH